MTFAEMNDCSKEGNKETARQQLASPLSLGDLNIGYRSQVQTRNDPHPVCKFQHHLRGGIHDHNSLCARKQHAGN